MSGKYARDDALEWEKPDWALKKTTKSTATGAAAKAGQNLASDITNAAANADAKGIGWEKPSWAGGGSASGVGGQNLASDITNAAANADAKGIGWQKPAWATGGPKLKSTAKGEKLKSGASDLARPITFPKGK